MSDQLLIFPVPHDVPAALVHDTAGWRVVGYPATHPTGVPCVAFDIPAGTPQANGAQLELMPKAGSGKGAIIQHGILHLNRPGYPYPWTPGQTAALACDVFYCPDLPVGLPPLVANGLFFGQVVP